jgi:hypothetical protein
MKIQVNNCLKCPFIVEDVDFDSVGNEICTSCNLLKFLRLEHIEEHRFRSFNYEEWFEQEYLEPSEHCPLKNMDKIEIKLEL